MEFWGVEVKSGEPLKVSPGDGKVLHLSQACLGELKKEKGNESVFLFVNVDGKKLVLGTLFAEKLPQQQFDLIFDRDFEISHNCKSASVYLYGYTASNPFDEDELPEGESDDSEAEEDTPLATANNGKHAAKPKEEKPAEAAKVGAAKEKKVSDAGKQKVKIVEPKKDEDDEISDGDAMSEDDDDDSEDMDDSDDSETSNDKDTPKKAEPSKKRPAESSIKTPVQDKKAKATPQKTDGKKAVEHVATPHPSKQTGKKDQANKPNQQTPKSGGSILCKSCNRTFGSDKALESHSKAKHGGTK